MNGISLMRSRRLAALGSRAGNRELRGGKQWLISRAQCPHRGRADLQGRGGRGRGYPYAERGQGWVTFAGIMLMIAGVLNVVYGISAISEAHFYVANTRYVIGELATWG